MRVLLYVVAAVLRVAAGSTKHAKDIKLQNLITRNKLPNPDLVIGLEEAITTLGRQNLLQPEDFIFDFNNLAVDPSQKSSGKPNPRTGFAGGLQGHTVTASSASFPALIGEDVSMSIGTIGPCGMNTPHTHPRATEFNYVVSGNFTTGMFQENGARFVLGNASAGQASLFPRGSIHFEANLGCDTAVFVAAFSNPEGGVLQVAQGFFGIAPTILDPVLGHTLNTVQTAMLHQMIPANVARGLQECLLRCPIPVLTAPVIQRLLLRTHITGYAYGVFVVGLLIFFGLVHLGHRLGLSKNMYFLKRVQRYLMFAPTWFGPPKKGSDKANRIEARMNELMILNPEKAKRQQEKNKRPYPGLQLPARGDIILISLFWVANIVLTVWDLDEEQPAREAFHRTGWLATWNTIAAVILSLKASPLPWIVGKSHDGLVFYHKWIALTAFVEVWIHSIWGMFVVKYLRTDSVFRWQPAQTGAWISTIAFTIIVGVAWAPWVAKKHFEMFLVLHVIGYIALMVGLWVHNSLLPWYVVVLIALWVVDRFTRLLFLCYLRGFHKQYATLYISNQSTRVVFERKQNWSAGSHIYINFPDCKPLQSHPYTIASIVNGKKTIQEVVLRIQRSSPDGTGLSNALYDLVHQKGQICELPFNYHGPYGAAPNMKLYTRILCVGGGSGITMPISLLQSFCDSPGKDSTACTLVWCTRDIADFTAFDLEKIKGLGVHIYLYQTRAVRSRGMFETLVRKFGDVKSGVMPTSADRGRVTEVADEDDAGSIYQPNTSVSKQGFVANHADRAGGRRPRGEVNEMERILRSSETRNESNAVASESDMEKAIGPLKAASVFSNSISRTTGAESRAPDAGRSHADEDSDIFSTSSSDNAEAQKGSENYKRSSRGRHDSGRLTMIPAEDYFGHKSSPRLEDTEARIASVRANSSFLSDTRTTMQRKPPVEVAEEGKAFGGLTSVKQVDADEDEFSPASASIDRLRKVFGTIGTGVRPVWGNVLRDFLANATETDRLCVVVCGGAAMCRDVRNAVALCPATQQIDLHVEQFG